MKKLVFGILAVAIVALSSCVKDEYDNPGSLNVDPNITANTTITQLQAMATGPSVAITTDIVISGIVISSDAEGNFYKEIVIQDGGRGLSVQIDKADLDAYFPPGRRVFIKCKGLSVGYSNGNTELGFNDNGAIGRIPGSLMEQYILGGMWGLTVTPVVKNITAITATDANTLIRLDDAEFVSADANQTYANIQLQTSGQRYIEQCSSGSSQVQLYTSYYSTFAQALTPSGKGYIIGVYRPYNTTKELIIRDLNDVQMDSARCGSGPIGGTLIGIAQVRALYSGTTINAPANLKISGIVISDKANGNITANNLVIQDSTGGITVRFTGANSFNLGDKIEVSIGGQEISEYNGLLQLNNIPNTSANAIGTGTITPLVATVADILANGEAWESTLVKIVGGTLSGAGTTYSGNIDLTDASGVVTIYTRSSASFSGVTFPTTSVNVTAIIGDFNGRQLNLRDDSDVQ